MSSSYVRTQIKNFLEDESSESVVDLTAQFGELKEMIMDAEVQPDSPWLGLQFIGDDEIPIALAATNDQGKYRESGGIYFHVVDVARLGAGDGLLTRGETLRDLFRGRRIGSIIIDSVTPMNFDQGATLSFEDGYMSGSFLASYRCDIDL